MYVKRHLEEQVRYASKLKLDGLSPVQFRTSAA